MTTSHLQRFFAVIFLGWFCTLNLQAQEPIEPPENWVKRLYQPYLAKEDTQECDALPPLLSSEATTQHPQGYLRGKLDEAVKKLLAAQEKDDSVIVDYDLLVDGQDFEIKHFTIKSTPSKSPSKETKVEVQFTNFGEKRHFVFTLELPEGSQQWALTSAQCLLGHENQPYDFAEAILSFTQAKR